MAQSKEDQQEKARQRKINEEWEIRNGDILRGRPLRPGEGTVARSEWDTGVFDPTNRHAPIFYHYNYRMARSEWSTTKVPDDRRDDYDSAKWPKLPDGRSAVMYPEEARKLRIATALLEITPENIKETPKRRWVLPPIDKLRGGGV